MVDSLNTRPNPFQDSGFVTTHWSVVMAAGQGDSGQAADALEQLCQTYWYPLYAYVRRQGHGPQDAEDLTQEFTTLFSPKDMPAPEREQHRIFGFAVSPAQDRVVAAADYRLFLCDLRAGAVLTTVATAPVFNLPGSRWGRLTFSPDGGTLAVGSDDGRVAFLDAVTLQPLREPAKLHSSGITHIAYALNGAVLVTGGGFGSGIKVTDVANGTTLWDIPDAHGSFPVEALAVSADGRRLATGGANQSVL